MKIVQRNKEVLNFIDVPKIKDGIPKFRDSIPLSLKNKQMT